MLWLAMLPSAWPCAALVTSEADLAASDTQEVIFRHDGDHAVVEYRVEYDGDAAELGWIIPVSGDFVGLADGDEADFEALRDASQPTVEWQSVDDGGGFSGVGCAKSGADNALRGDQWSDVDLIAEGFTGTYEYAVLEAESEDSLAGWAEDNGFNVDAASSAVADYLDEGPILLVKVAPQQAETPVEGSTLPPLVLTYDGPWSFPARMGRTTSTQQMNTTVYVLGSERARISEGWQQVDLTWLSAEGDPLGDYENEVLGVGLQTGYVRIHAGPYGDAFLTRFQTIAPNDVHTVDPVFVDDDGLAEMHLTISAWGEADTGSSAAWLLLPLLGMGWTLRRRD